jgi:hypothetical protein
MAMNVIRGKRLTAVDISPHGQTVSINVVDEAATPGSLVLAAECLRARSWRCPK